MVGGRWVGLFVLHNGKKRNTREKKDTRGRKRIHEGNQSIINQSINQYHSEGGPGKKKKRRQKMKNYIILFCFLTSCITDDKNPSIELKEDSITQKNIIIKNRY